MQSRQLIIVISQVLPTLPDSVKLIGQAETAKNLLGQEFSFIVFDARLGLNLEALAIAVGCLKAGGQLWLILSQWQDLNTQLDNDSLRWSGLDKPICSYHFIRYFKQLVEKYRFPIVYQFPPFVPPIQEKQEPVTQTATAEQQQIITEILNKQNLDFFQNNRAFFFLTAKRGRGKSALLGLLANQLNEPIYLTAPNKNAVKILQQFAKQPINFIAPDALLLQLKTDANFALSAQNTWLLVDEAAMLPIGLLQQLSGYFKALLFATTIHSYEGTGRGFLLKFKAKINQPVYHFELQQPLRWLDQDPLESFIEELLLLNVEVQIPPLLWQPDLLDLMEISPITQAQLASSPQAFYALLTQAHYRTSPVDLRRLFDGKNQQFFIAQSSQHLLGALWLLQEGNMQDGTLISQIQRGQRRPKGNLVPQSLCFQANLPQACQLSSLRISRIAVQPYYQQRGIGTVLINYLKQQAKVDFLSASFAYSPELAQFWQSCGFSLVQIGEYLETRSGCYSAIVLYGISTQGKALVKQAKAQFKRDFPLTFHPLAQDFYQSIDWQLNDVDKQVLKNFPDYHRTLFSTLPALRRLLHNQGVENFPLLSEYCHHRQIPCNKKSWLAKLRAEIKTYLTNKEI